MLLFAKIGHLDLTSGTEGYGIAMANHGHSGNETWQGAGARASIANTDQQEEAQWKEKAHCNPEEI